MALIPIRQFNDIVTPQSQMFAGRGGRDVYGGYENYLSGLADQLPEASAIAEQRRMIEENQRQNEIARQQARRDANVSLGLQSANVGVKAYPYIKNLISKPTEAVAKQVPSMLTSEAADASLWAGSAASTTTSEGASLASQGAGRVASTASPKAGGYLAQLGAKGAAGTLGVGSLAGTVYSALSDQTGISKKLHESIGGGKKEWDVGGAALSGAMTGWAATGFTNPLGAVFGAAGGLLSGLF